MLPEEVLQGVCEPAWVLLPVTLLLLLLLQPLVLPLPWLLQGCT